MQALDPRTLPLRGTQLVEASAGTGKTHTITWLVLRLLLERGLDLGQILVVTFTEAATAELRARVRRRLRDAARVLAGRPREGEDPLLIEWLLSRGHHDADRARLEAALGRMDEAPIFTIHGLCQRVLEEHAFESGARFDLELQAETASLLLEVVQDFWARELHRVGPAEVRYLARRGVNLGWLLELARVVTDWPALPVLPAASPVDPGPRVAEFVLARQAAARAWSESRDAVMVLLRTSPALNRGSYRLSSLGSWQAELETMLAQTEPSTPGVAKSLARFTEAGLAQGSKRNAPPPAHPFFRLCGRLEASLLRAEQELEAWRLGFLQQFVTQVRSEFARRKQGLGVRSFADLLEQVAQALTGGQGAALARRLRRHYPAAVVDEFQDTDPVQHQILSTLYSGPESTLLLIGDPKQAIYGFRGADVFAYLGAARRIGHDHAWTLSTNYRSDPGLLGAINRLFGDHPAPFLYPEIRYPSVSPRPGATDVLRRGGAPLAAFDLAFIPRQERAGLRCQRIPKRWAEAELPSLVAAEIVGLLEVTTLEDGTPIEPGHIAVLARTNRQAEAIGQALLRARVPSVLFAQASVLDATEAREVAVLLRALVTPTRPSAVRTALATPLFALSGADILALETDEEAWQAWLERFQNWHDRWERRGFIQAFSRCLSQARIPPRLLARPGGERKLTNLLHLGELLHGAETSEHLGMAGLLRWFEQVRHDPRAREEVAAEARQIRLETDERAVMLVTSHKSKGLEYPIVICPYLWDGTTLRKRERQLLRYHAPGPASELLLDLRDEGDPEKAPGLDAAEGEALAEQLRLVYVALTRARHRVSVILGGFNSYEGSALAYLLHHPRDARALPPAAVASRVKEQDDAGLLRELEQFARRSGPSVEVRTVEPTPLRAWQPPRSQAVELECPSSSRVLPHAWRSSSFTGLTARSLESPAGLEGRGRDELEIGLPVLHRDESARKASTSILMELPRGAAVGTLVHALLEKVDFTHPETLEQLAREELARRQDLGSIDPFELAHALREALTTPLSAGRSLRLVELRPERCLKELEFLLPVGSAGSSLTPAGLARIFARWAEHPVPSDYAARIAELGFPALLGYLRGFIDLVFEDGGRYYIVDYKTNHLGSSAEDYASQRLTAAMVEHHYLLQYHLYAVALNRLLAFRIPDYDYEQHFGGVYYLFLRGIDPARKDGHGVFFDRPPRALLGALERELEGASPQQGAG